MESFIKSTSYSHIYDERDVICQSSASLDHSGCNSSVWGLGNLTGQSVPGLLRSGPMIGDAGVSDQIVIRCKFP